MTKSKLGTAALLSALVATLTATGAQARPATTDVAQDAATSAALTILKEIGTGAAQSAGGKGLAQALSIMGVGGDPGTTAQLAEIQQSLERVNTQLTSLRNDTALISRAVTESNYNNAARDALPILNGVDFAEAKLKSAAAQPAGSKEQKILADEARSYIGTNLLDKGTLLASLVSGSGPSAPDSIIGAAWKVRTQDNFLTPEDSVQLRYLVDYYAAYEAALTQLVAAYYRSSPGYPASEIQRLVDQTTATVTNQLDHRRDAVPDGTVVDARTGLMWYTTSTFLTTDPNASIASGAYTGTRQPYTLTDPTLKPQPTDLGGWTLPTQSQLQGLISGWNGQPSEWLMKNAGFPAPLLAGIGSERNSEFWTSTGAFPALGKVTPTPSLPFGLGPKNPAVPVMRAFIVVNMLTGAVAARDTGGNSNQHGYIPVRATPPGSYLP